MCPAAGVTAFQANPQISNSTSRVPFLPSPLDSRAPRPTHSYSVGLDRLHRGEASRPVTVAGKAEPSYHGPASAATGESFCICSTVIHALFSTATMRRTVLRAVAPLYRHAALSTSAGLNTTYGFVGLGKMGFPMATNLRLKLPRTDSMYIYDINTDATKKMKHDFANVLRPETHAALLVATDLAEVVAKCVSPSLFFFFYRPTEFYDERRIFPNTFSLKGSKSGRAIG